MHFERGPNFDYEQITVLEICISACCAWLSGITNHFNDVIDNGSKLTACRKTSITRFVIN